MKFPAIIIEEDGVFVVSFRDIPEALTQGYTLSEAIMMAEDALLTAMDFYFEDMRLVPKPSAAEDGEFLISLPLSAVTKILLLNTMLEQRISKKKLADRMGVSPQQLTRIVNLKHTTKIDTLQNAFKALGCELVFTVSDCADQQLKN